MFLEICWKPAAALAFSAREDELRSDIETDAPPHGQHDAGLQITRRARKGNGGCIDRPTITTEPFPCHTNSKRSLVHSFPPLSSPSPSTVAASDFLIPATTSTLATSPELSWTTATTSSMASGGNILALPFRRTHPVRLSDAIKTYISSKYDQHPAQFQHDLEVIDQLRKDAVSSLEAHASGVRKIQGYAAQLVWMGGKFPVDVRDPTISPSLATGGGR